MENIFSKALVSDIQLLANLISNYAYYKKSIIKSFYWSEYTENVPV